MNCLPETPDDQFLKERAEDIFSLFVQEEMTNSANASNSSKKQSILARVAKYLKEKIYEPRNEAVYSLSGPLIDPATAASELKTVQLKLEEACKTLDDYKYAVDKWNMIFMLNADGLITDVNENFCSVTGYTKDELTGETMRILDDGYHSPEFYKSLWQTISTGNIWNGQVKGKKKNGEFYWADAAVTPFIGPDGVPFQYMGIQKNITREREAEAALVANNERFTHVMAATFDVIWDWDIVNSTIYYSDAYKSVFGYEPGVYPFSLKEEILAETIHAGDIDAVIKSMKEALYSSKKYWHCEYRRLKRKGGFAVVAVKSIIIRGENGQAVRLAGAMQDITSRRNVITSLNNSVEKIWSLLHNISDIITLVDENGVIHYESASDKGVLGYDEFEVVGRNIFRLLHPDDRELVAAELARRKEEGFVMEPIECRLLHKNGSYVQVEMQVNNLLESTVIKGVILTSRDITLRKKKEEEKNELLRKLKIENEEKKAYAAALEESEKRYKYLFEESPAPLIIWDFKTFNILDCNEAVLVKYGYTRQEFLALNIKDLRQPYEGSLSEPALENEENYINMRQKIWQHKKKSGEIIFVQVTGFHFNYEGTEAVFSHINDITEMLDATRKLQESEERYKLMFYKSPLPKIIYDIGTLKIVDANDAFVLDYGYDLTELKSMTVRSFIVRSDLKGFLQMQDGDMHKANDMASVGVFTFWNKSKRKLIADVFANKFLYNGVECMLMGCVNATERVAAQEKIRKTSERLRQLATYLNDIREDDKANIAREIHDELGQQLTGLKMDVYWLKEELPLLDEGKKLQFESILKLIDSTISTVRKIATALRPIMLDDLGLLETLKLHSLDYGKRYNIKVELSSNLADTAVPPKTAINIFRIFQETLTNVARHAGAKKIECHLKQQDGKITLKIKDDGKGFDVSKIAEKKTLGLIGMQERVLMLEGEFEINSHPGAGTEVVVIVPLKPAL